MKFLTKKLSISVPLGKQILCLLFVLVVAGCKKAGNAVPEPVPEESKEEEFFQIAVIPDTQYYTALKHNGSMEMFDEQINWIIANKGREKIAYVVHLGDMVDHGDSDNQTEWTRAKNTMYKLEKDPVPYGIAVGNHDQTPLGNPASPGTNEGYGLYFGRNHMQQFSWYGGAYGSSNNSDNHFDLFSANGTDYIVLYIEFNSPVSAEYSGSIETAVMNWAEGILTTYASRKAIIVSHSILDKPSGSNSDIRADQGNNFLSSNFTNQGEIIYQRMKLYPNVFLMLSGHISGEGFRRDVFNGNVIKSYLSDYQSRENAPFNGSSRNGGNGLMRLMKFSKTKQELQVRTFAPRIGSVIEENDRDSRFTEPLFN